jgi:hypothetical protein
MSRRLAAAFTAGLLLASATPAPGHGGGPILVSASYYSYPVYYQPAVPASVFYFAQVVGPPVPVYLAPAPVACPVPAVVALAPVATTPAPLPAYAVPTPAPPSSTPPVQTREPPLQPGAGPGPKVTESRSAGGSQPATVEAKKADTGRYRVGFWNVTGRDLTLTVDGQSRVLPRNQSVTLTLGRQFTWQVDQRAPLAEDVPAGRSTLEIVIRR